MAGFFKAVANATKQTAGILEKGAKELEVASTKLNESIHNYRYFDGELSDALLNLVNKERLFYHIPTHYYDIYYLQYKHGSKEIFFSNERYSTDDIIFDFKIDDKDYHATISRAKHEKDYDTLRISEGTYGYKLKLRETTNKVLDSYRK